MSNVTTTLGFLTTTEPTFNGIPEAWGYIGVVVVGVFFGSNLVPVKKFETGDGVFFQFISSAVMWSTGLVTNCIRGSPKFYPLALLGGVSTAIGNFLLVPVIQTIGLGQGMCIWTSLNLIIGWAAARFGFYGITPQVPPSPVLNYIGVGLCTISAVAFTLVKSTIPIQSTFERHTFEVAANEVQDEPLIPSQGNASLSTIIAADADPTEPTIYHRCSAPVKRIGGTVMAIVTGLAYSHGLLPIIYINDNYPSEKHAWFIDYAFAHFTGMFATTALLFALYCALMRNSPVLYPRSILPSMGSGLMWALAALFLLITIQSLSAAVCFPITSTIPLTFAAFWGIFFKEIKGTRNFVVLAFAIALAISGCVITGFSHTGDTHNSTQHDTLHSWL